MSDYQAPTPQRPATPAVPPVRRQYQSNPQRPKPPEKPRTSRKAIMSFLLGLAGMLFWIFTGLPALILGFTAKQDIKHKEHLSGNGLANCGIILGGLSFFVAPVIVIIMLIGMASGGASNEYYVDDSDRIVHIHLAGALTEAAREDPFSVFGAQPGSFRVVLDTLEHLEDDDSVVALVLTINGFRPSMAHMEEIYHAINKVEESGVDVYVHIEEAMLPMSTYIMLSGAKYINVVPTGFLNLSGMYREGMYLKDGLAKIGLEADIVHIGDYKSAGETMMLNGPSKEAEEAMNWMMDALYSSSVAMIAESRGIDRKVVRSMLDIGPYTAEDAAKVKLIDSCMYQDDLLSLLKEKYGEDIYIENNYGPGDGSSPDTSPFESIFEDFVSSSSSGSSGLKSVGIVYVEGNIMPGYGSGAFSGTVRKALEEAADDRNLKAVVMRINSPGGSVTASEVIWRAAELLNEKKPFVVSMGSVAASGGYYIACGADAIYADATTITGSIGVVGGKIVTTGMWDELGINWHPYQRGANADWMSTAEPFNQFQRQQIVEQMGAAYATFKDHVTEGRGDKLKKDLESMAGGRVFTGRQALDLGLIDEIGGLNDAIDHAAELANLKGKYRVRTIPKIKTFGELLEEEFLGNGGSGSPADLSLDVQKESVFSLEKVQKTLGASHESARLMALLNTFEPARSQEVYRMLQSAELLNTEGVMVMMPTVSLLKQ